MLNLRRWAWVKSGAPDAANTIEDTGIASAARSLDRRVTASVPLILVG